MSEFPFQRFLDLVHLDQQINKLVYEQKQLQQESLTYKERIDQLKTDLETVKKRLSTAKKEVDAKELEMEELGQKQKNKEQQLDRVSNQREYQSLTHEIEKLKQAQHAFEEQLLQVWHVLEATTREYTIKSEETAQQIMQAEKAMEELASKAQALTESIDQARAQRPDKEKGLPVEWLEKYALMRESVSNPVVPVINDSCSACFYSLSAQDLSRVRRNGILQCKQCYRFLYME